LQAIELLEKVLKKWAGRKKRIKILGNSNFPERVVEETVRCPRNFTGLTLVHGKGRARDMLLERAKKRMPHRYQR
jgi:hypothetical protein